jgi:hypothetical protein
LIKKFKNILAKDPIQRVIYGIGLLLWTLIMWDSIYRFPNSISSLKISYLTLYIIPATILLIQILRNNKLFWLLTFGLFSSYILTSVIMVLSDIIERSGNHVKAIIWSIDDIIILIVLLGFLGIIDWIIYHLKPQRLI